MANYNLFDAASLAMVPTGVKDGKLYSVKPDNGSGDFTFSRGSDWATRVNADGLIEKERTNFLTYSNSFSSWGGSGTTMTSGQSGYDGTNDAWLLDITAGVNSQYRGINVTASGVHTTSIYAKAGTLNWVLLLTLGGANCYFDLENGVVGNNQYIIDANIEQVGATDWYRISITQSNSINQLRIYPASGNSNITQTSGSIYIQDTQVEQGLVATDYIETTTSSVTAGITDDLPRIDYSNGCGALLLEPSRTNVTPYSEYLDALPKIGMTTTSNATTSPEGVVNASKIAYDSGTAYIAAATGVTTGVDQTFSGFFKADESNYVIVNQAGAGATNAVYNLADGTHSAPSGITTDMIDYGDGWWRIIYSVNLTYNAFRVFLSSNGNYGSYPSTSEGFFAYGFQVEQGSYPTSYIPTYGSSATRTLEYYSNNSATDLIGQTEGTLFIEFAPNTDIISTKWLAFLGGGSNYIGIYVVNGTNKIRLEVAATTNQATFDSTSAIVKGQTYRCAIAYANNDFTAYVNGVQLGTDTNGIVPTTSTIRSHYNLSSVESTETKQLSLFKSRLTNTELAALTRPYDTYQEWVDGEGLTWESKSCTVQNIVELQNL